MNRTYFVWATHLCRLLWITCDSVRLSLTAERIWKRRNVKCGICWRFCDDCDTGTRPYLAGLRFLPLKLWFKVALAQHRWKLYHRFQPDKESISVYGDAAWKHLSWATAAKAGQIYRFRSFRLFKHFLLPSAVDTKKFLHRGTNKGFIFSSYLICSTQSVILEKSGSWLCHLWLYKCNSKTHKQLGVIVRGSYNQLQ